MAREGLRLLRGVFGNRALKEAQRVSLLNEKLLKVGKATLLHQHWFSKPTAHWDSALAAPISRSWRLFLLKKELGEVIQHLARCQLTPRSSHSLSPLLPWGLCPSL